ncbi:MAG: hypothetical protein COA78_34650 [Blastopirellula sp.]|nr:MAG: hypothetical protein COA78_34650 [Blastopirellula sp.]
MQENIAFAITCYLIVCLIIPLGSAWWHSRGGLDESAWIYSFFPLPLILLMTCLGYFGSTEWLNIPLNQEDFLKTETINLWWMANGIIYCFLGIMGLCSKIRVVRFWGTIF